ncbi:MAG: electron transporter RnfC [Thiotrichales bacterium SG8_50]|nr:MAG: electron transporter RnfC [Thiotrichales bacterium SG8_50]
MRLHSFHGGLHLPGHKEMSMREPVRPAGIPQTLVLPLQQHIGEPAEPCVKPGQRVRKGEVLAHASGYVSVPLHAPTSGRVVAIEPRSVAHPSGLQTACIVLEPDGADSWTELTPRGGDYEQLDPSALRNLIREAGIVGLGGAGFPSFIKLNPGSASITTLVLNGAECEPYITCDAMLMCERAVEIVSGALIMRHALHAEHCVIGVEDNKPAALAALRQAAGELGSDVEIVEVPTIYPAGGEKQLIKTLTGKEVPSNGLPVDIGVVCHNVGTAAAVYRAVVHGQPLIARYVTVTGHAVANPRNMEVLIGTPIADLLHACGLRAHVPHKIIVGGPMMGFELRATHTPVVKTTNCVLAASEEDAATRSPPMPCIRCGECAAACPAQLLPQQLYWHAQAKDFDRIQDYNLFDCIECGCCAYVCPSNIALVHYYRYAKTEIWAQEREKHKADLARERHEFHKFRLEREKAEREERHRKKREALANKSTTDASKKAAIEAALARVKAKRGEARPDVTDGGTQERSAESGRADAPLDHEDAKS